VREIGNKAKKSMCVCERERHADRQTEIGNKAKKSVCVCVYVCMCVCVRERQTEIGNKAKKEYVFVCVREREK